MVVAETEFHDLFLLKPDKPFLLHDIIAPGWNIGVE